MLTGEPAHQRAFAHRRKSDESTEFALVKQWDNWSHRGIGSHAGNAGSCNIEANWPIV